MAKAALNKKNLFPQQIGPQYKEETGEMLHLERIFVYCRHLDT